MAAVGAALSPSRHAALAVFAAAMASVVLIPAVPSYDPWSWLLWGREVAHGTLSTAGGPAFKPLPVAVCALLAPLGDLAPTAWVVLARAAAIGAVVLAFVVARRRTGAGGGLLAAVGVALCGSFVGLAATGAVEPMVVCFVLAGVLAWEDDRPRVALAFAVACALLRVEAWPFLLAFGVLLWRRRPEDRALLVACAIAVPALWFVPEWLGSGDVLRSGSRARVPNPGQPALADVPLLASLRDAVALPLLPLLVAALFSPARRLALAGLAWIALVAVMAQLGFSGEARYAVPGAALLAMAGAIGIARLGAAPVAAVALVAVVIMVVPRLGSVADVRASQTYQARLAGDLRTAIRTSGGRDALLRCGRPYTGQYRGPLTAYALEVEKRRVGFAPQAPGVVLQSRRFADAPKTPALLPGGRTVRHGLWTVQTTC